MMIEDAVRFALTNGFRTDECNINSQNPKEIDK